MAKLLMVTGLGSVKDLVSDKRGAFYNTLEEFHKYWERIDIIAPRVRGHKSGITELFGNVFIHVSRWPLILHPFWFLKKGIEIYRAQKFDLMTVQEYPPFYNGLGAKLLEKLIKVPYIIEIHHIVGYPKAANIKEEIYRSLMKIFIEWDSRKTKAVRVVNQDQVPQFLIEAGIPKEKIIYISSLYIDLDIFKPTGISKDYDLIFVGRLEANKGVDLFLETVEKLNCKAIIVGDGALKNEIKLKIENWKLQDNILLYGWAKDQREIAELLNKSRILVMPSYNEGGPRVVVEALACGVPVLATPVGMVPDLLKNGLGGEIIAWDANDMASKIRALLSDFERYQKYSQKGLEIARKFEKKAAIRNYADKLKLLI